MIKEKKALYNSPDAEILKLKMCTVICQSMRGGFEVGGGGNVGQGDDNDLNDVDLGW